MEVRVAVVGARAGTPDRRTSIGYYHLRELHKAGAGIVAIVNSTLESAIYSCGSAARDYRISPLPYDDFGRMLREQKPDAVVIASPNRTHFPYAEKALKAGSHVMVEKPLYDADKSPERNLEKSLRLFELAERYGLILTVNTQTVADLDEYRRAHSELFSDDKEFRPFRFEIVTDGGRRDLQIPIDLLQHPLSHLLRIDVLGKVSPSEMEVRQAEQSTELIGNFSTHDRMLPFSLYLGSGDPRLGFGFDNLFVARVRRGTSLNPAYFLDYRNKTILALAVEDSLAVADRRFVEAVNRLDRSKLLISTDESTTNITQMVAIMEKLIASRK